MARGRPMGLISRDARQRCIGFSKPTDHTWQCKQCHPSRPESIPLSNWLIPTTVTKSGSSESVLIVQSYFINPAAAGSGYRPGYRRTTSRQLISQKLAKRAKCFGRAKLLPLLSLVPFCVKCLSSSQLSSLRVSRDVVPATRGLTSNSQLPPGTCPCSPRRALKRMPKVPCNHRIPSTRLPSGVSTARW